MTNFVILTNHFNNASDRSYFNFTFIFKYDKTIDPVKTAVIWPEPKQPVSKMKTDPVNRYQQYAQQWNKSKVPEEKTHKNLRWSIREQMLYKDIIYEVCMYVGYYSAVTMNPVF